LVKDNRSSSRSPRSLPGPTEKHVDGCSVGRKKTSRQPLMQEAAAGGSQIHFTPALAVVCPITIPSRIPMVTTVAM
jgi:hypothetical protein